MSCLRILLLLIVSACIACGQSASRESKITKELFNSISKNVKVYSYNPRYSMRLSTAACNYEIYINDMLADFDFSSSSNTGIIPFPELILKSGKQKISIRIFPKSRNTGLAESTISPEAKLELEIFHEEYGKFIKTPVLKTSLPAIAPGLPYLDLTQEFDATVPYTLKGWMDGVDLSKEDAKELEREVLSVYKTFKQAFNDKDVATIASMIYGREKESAQAWQITPEREGNSNHAWEQWEQEVQEVKSIELLSGYTLRVFGFGKVVALLVATGKDRDRPIIKATTKEDFNFYPLYLYRPRQGAPLEVIR